MAMRSVASSTSSYLLVPFLVSGYFPPGVRAESFADVVTCYYHDGSVAANNTLCPGSSSCCGINDTCVSNKLCHKAGDAEGTYVRGPCAVVGWGANCPQVCLYDEIEGYFPRASQCDDGSWCCDNDRSCCANGAGSFLDATGNIASVEASVTTSYPPAEGTSTGRLTVTPSAASRATSTLPAAITATSGSSPASSSPTRTPSTPTSLAAPLGLGLGLGVPLAALLAGGAAWLILRRKRRQQAARRAGGGSRASSSSPSPSPTTEYQAFVDWTGRRPLVAELDSAHRKLDAYALRDHHEMGASDPAGPRHELENRRPDPRFELA